MRVEGPQERRRQTMNTNGLAKHYDALTAMERFCLIWAAVERDDAQEQHRLMSAAKRLYYSEADVAPLMTALEAVARFTFLDLLDEAAKHREAWERWSEVDERDYIHGKKRKSASKK